MEVDERAMRHAVAERERYREANFHMNSQVESDRVFLEAYEAAKAEQPDERTLSQKIDEVGKRLIEQQGDDQFRKLFWRIAKTLKCLPSTFADGNEHVIEAANKAMEQKSGTLTTTDKYAIADNIVIEGRSKSDVVQDVFDELAKSFELRRRA